MLLSKSVIGFFIIRSQLSNFRTRILPPSIFVILVIMALVTTFMATSLLHFVERFLYIGKKVYL